MIRYAIALVALYAASSVVAQRTNATCDPSYNWMTNSIGQSPCLVAAYLQGGCSESTFTVPALDPGDLTEHYVGPSDPSLSTPCRCSSATYNLVSACGACQLHTDLEKWNFWITNCSTEDVNFGYEHAIPPATAIPQWALQDVTVFTTFDVNAAYNVSLQHKPDLTAANPSPTATHKSNHTPAIIGGAVGGLVIIAAFVVLITLLVIRNKRRANAPQFMPADRVDPPPAKLEFAPFIPTQPYNPNDPRTYPSHMPATPTTIYTSTPQSAGFANGTPPVGFAPSPPAGYTITPPHSATFPPAPGAPGAPPTYATMRYPEV